MCVDCYNNCYPSITDKCVKYTGEDIPLFDICEGEPISKLQEVIVEKLISVLDGTGISLKDVTLDNCEYLKDAFNAKDPTLVNLIQLLIDNQCTLKDLVDDLGVTETYVFDTKCLEGDVSDKDKIIQALINSICSIKTTVTTMSTTYVKLADVNSLVQNIITPPNAVPQYGSRLFPDSPVPYIGSLSNFDNTGKGIATLGFDKVFIMNGLNGTLDWRGRTVVGSVRGVPGGSLDSAVDPNNPINPSTNYATGDKFGENYHVLTASEGPVHTHTLTDPGHSHSYTKIPVDGGRCSGGDCFKPSTDGTGDTTGTSTTGITISPSTGGASHNNRQPSVAAVWIVYKS